MYQNRNNEKGRNSVRAQHLESHHEPPNKSPEMPSRRSSFVTSHNNAFLLSSMNEKIREKGLVDYVRRTHPQLISTPDPGVNPSAVINGTCSMVQLKWGRRRNPYDTLLINLFPLFIFFPFFFILFLDHRYHQNRQLR